MDEETSRQSKSRPELLLGIGLPSLLAVLAAGALVAWMSVDSIEGLDLRTPGLDGRETATGPSNATIPEPGEPIGGPGRASAVSGSWPCFRGPNRDGISRESVPLARQWPPGGPPVLWTVELGPGHAGPAVADGRVFVLDYDPQTQADTIRCLSLDDGQEIWRNGYPVPVAENHGMSRTVPAVAEGCVVTLGPKCHAACWDVESGRCLWLIDLVAQYSAKVPAWYTGQCPLVDGDRVILVPAGDVFMMAVELKTGRVIWKTPKLHNWEMTHVSVVPMEAGGRRTYVYCGSKGVAGVAADDGRVLWESTDWVGKMATCPSPVPLGDGRVFFCGGYGAGSVMLKVEQAGERLVAAELFRLAPKQFGSEQHTPIYYEGHLYGVHTKPGGEQLVCLAPDGAEQWNSGRDKIGRGPYLIANGLIYALADDGRLLLIEAASDQYRPLAECQAIENAHDAWAPMALVAGRLILRDLGRMVCLDVADRSGGSQ